MKVVLDPCVPRPLRKFLPEHSVHTAQEMVWAELKNRALIKEAESQFHVFVTSDQNLKYRQNITGIKLAILVPPTNDRPAIRAKTSEIAVRVSGLKAGDFIELTWN